MFEKHVKRAIVFVCAQSKFPNYPLCLFKGFKLYKFCAYGKVLHTLLFMYKTNQIISVIIPNFLQKRFQMKNPTNNWTLEF